MQLYKLPLQTTAVWGLNWKVTYDYTDVAALATDTAATVVAPDPDQTGLTLPVGSAVLAAGHRLITAFDFSDAAINSLLVEVGDDGDPNRFVDQTQIAVDGTEVFYALRVAATTPYVYLAANTIDATFTAAGGANPTLAETTSGSGEIYLGIFDFTALENV